MVASNLGVPLENSNDLIFLDELACPADYTRTA